MDQKFNIGGGHFERMLREKTDEFRMYPSKRVWYSIYNNMHPGRKWPSIAMSITLIALLLITGYINTDNSKKNKFVVAANATNTIYKTKNIISSVNTSVLLAKTDPLIVKNGTEQNYIYSGLENSLENNINTGTENNHSAGNNTTVSNKDADNIRYSAETFSPDKINRLKGIVAPTYKIKTIPAANNIIAVNNSASVDDIADVQKKKEAFADMNNTDEKAWIEDYALHNKPVRKRSADRLGVQVYATPSVVFGTLSDNLQYEENANTLTNTPGSTDDINAVVDHKPSLGLEAGAAMQYSLSKILRVKAGLQFNYTRYTIKAYETNHPVASSLTFNDFDQQRNYNIYNSSSLSTVSGIAPVMLPNKTYQLSIPVGLEFKIAGNDVLQLNVGATIQPTFVMGGNAYLLSSDRKNYINDPSLINQWNLNAGFETFVSYKINGLTWQLGPQFRRQFASTYSNKYAISENLNNYGIKIGVSKTIE